MSKISGISQVFALLRQQALKSGANAINASCKSEAGKARTGSEMFVKPTLAEVLQETVQMLEPDMSFEEKTKKIMRVIMAWEFGDELLDDPSFSQLLDNVFVTVQQSDVLQKDFETLFEQD